MIPISIKWTRDTVDLDELARALAEDVARLGVDVVIKQLKGVIERFTPVGETGDLVRSLGTKTEVYPEKHLVMGIAGPRTGTRGNRKAHLVEFGHLAVAPRKVKKASKGRARAKGITFVPARPFMRPAVETYAAYALTEMAAPVEQALAVALIRRRRKKTETVIV